MRAVHSDGGEAEESLTNRLSGESGVVQPTQGQTQDVVHLERVGGE